MKTTMTAIALLAGTTYATDLSNNLSSPTGGSETATTTRVLTAGFSTDASAYTLGSVTLQLANPVAGAAQLYLYNTFSFTNGGLEPGSVLGTLTSPAGYSEVLAPATFTTPGIALSPNSTYWLVLVPLSGQFSWAWAADNNGAGIGFQKTWGVSEDSGQFWWTQNTYQLQMSVTTGGGSGCYANCDGSTVAPVLNVQDFSCFLNRFAAADTWANCDGSTVAPVLNVQDFSCFLNRFAAGCS